jgi:hypothetical protein
VGGVEFGINSFGEPTGFNYVFPRVNFSLGGGMNAYIEFAFPMQ